MKYATRIPILAFIYMFALTMDAHAYLDPGTGSIILQGAIAAVAAGATAVTVYFHRVKMFFRSMFGGKTSKNDR